MKLKASGFVRPHDLIRRARSNLIRSRQEKPPGVLREDLCFNAYQAAENALKAVHLSHEISYRFDHDLGDMINCLKENNVEVPEYVEGARWLSRFALPVLARDSVPPEYISTSEHERAVKTAGEVFNWAAEQLEGFSPIYS